MEAVKNLMESGDQNNKLSPSDQSSFRQFTQGRILTHVSVQKHIDS